MIRDAIYDLVARNRYGWFGRRDACILPNSDRRTAPKLRDDGAWRWLAAAGMTKEAALLQFNSVRITVSTICRVSFVWAQARIEAE
jgi:hypothetical protein